MKPFTKPRNRVDDSTWAVVARQHVANAVDAAADLASAEEAGVKRDG